MSPIKKQNNIQESVKYTDWDAIDNIEFSTYLDEEEMIEDITNTLQDQYNVNYEEAVSNPEMEEIVNTLRNEYIKENLKFDCEFYDRDGECIGTESDWLLSEPCYSDIDDEIIEMILDEYNRKPSFDGDYSINEILYNRWSNYDDIYEAAKHLFPTYDEYFKGLRGFILSDGTIIGTEEEHNECLQLKGVEDKFDFITMGNIRIIPNSIDIGKEPTYAQQRVLQKMIDCYADEELYLDVWGNGQDGGCQYTQPEWQYVLGEIDRYYSHGILPKGGNAYDFADDSWLDESIDIDGQVHPEEKDEYTIGDEGDGNLGYFHTTMNEGSNKPNVGIYINCDSEDFDLLIRNGWKTIETRNINSLKKIVNQRVGLIKTIKNKPNILFAYATIGEPIKYSNEKEFVEDENKHLVVKGSKYFIKNKKYGYPLINVETVNPPVALNPRKNKVQGINKFSARYIQEEGKKIIISEKQLEVIKEGYSDILYHFTTFDSLLNILEENCLSSKLSDPYGDGYKFSFSRAYRSDMGYPAMNNNANNHKGETDYCLVRLTIDGRMLKNKYKGFPYNHFSYVPKTDGMKERNYNPFEFEDCVIAPNDIKPFTDYILGIDVLFRWLDEKNKDFFANVDDFHRVAFLEEYMNDLQTLNEFVNEFDMNANIYFNEDDFNNLSKKGKGMSCENAIFQLEEFLYQMQEEDYYLDENINWEVAPEDVDLNSFEIEQTLYPRLWNENGELDSRVRLQLLDIADDFLECLNLKWVKPKDICLMGSICGYNWSEFSDVDLHIVMDFKDVDERIELVQDYCDAKKNQWNEEHTNLLIYGLPVEIYVEDVNAETKSNGIYSLNTNRWIKEPSIDDFEPIEDKDVIKETSAELMTIIDDLEKQFHNTSDKHVIEEIGDNVDKILAFLKTIRTSSLEKEGEMGNGNIDYKLLRRFGYLDKLYELSTQCYDAINSIP